MEPNIIDNGTVNTISHILIMDVDSEEILLKKRDIQEIKENDNETK